MNYQDFIEKIQAQILDYLPEKFADALVDVDQVVKNNDTVLYGLIISTDESNVFPKVYLESYYDMYKNKEADFDDIMNMISDVYMVNYLEHKIDLSAITDFDSVKDKIMCKLINEETNQKYLEDKPYTKLEDLAVIYQIFVGNAGDSVTSITITDEIMERYGITIDELHEQAMQNMETLQPYCLKELSDMVVDMIAERIVEDQQGISYDEAREMAFAIMPEMPETTYVLTTDSKINGASAILNDAARQEIAEKLGDFYVLPSSIHEVMIVPKSTERDLEELELMVRSVNGTEVEPDEVLSDHVYEYDAKEHELFRSDHAEERAKLKAEHRGDGKERQSLKDRLAEKKEAVMKPYEGKEHQVADRKMDMVH